MRRITGAALACGAIVLCSAAESRASGFEVPETGSVAMGRGGASLVRASDPSTLATNVAGILGLPGLQITLGSSFPVVSQCFTRSGRYDGPWNGTLVSVNNTPFAGGDDQYHTLGATYPRICNDTAVGVIPHLLATYRFGTRFAVGLGFYPPNTISSKEFPTTVAADANAGGSVTAPSPQRYMLVRSEGLILYPTIALAWAPLPWLRIGAAIQPSFADIEAVTHANASGGQSPSTDVTVDIKAKGFFLAGNIGAQILSSQRWSFGAHMHLSQIPRLRGTATQTLNAYALDPSTRIPFGSRPDNAEIDFVLPPLQARIGARYAHPRPGAMRQTDIAEDRSYDPMRDDVFDVEANLIYEMASANQYFHVINSKPEADFDYPRSTCPKPLAAGGGITTDVCFPRYWKDVFGVRVGGDFNAIPDVLALRAGVSYETGAQSTKGANLDALGHDTAGLHAGATFRPSSWISVHVAYAHYFMGDLDAKDGELSTVTLGGTVKPEQCADPTYGQGACTANRGLFEASLDTFNVGVTARF
jgi:long-subunit fatty acid transport protein